ncbi:MAG: translation initiation factor IF-2 [Elusimicrobia bacterium]|nr:translation initiation factor IF-2 [Elusimicrobiota bacterium]
MPKSPKSKKEKTAETSASEKKAPKKTEPGHPAKAKTAKVAKKTRAKPKEASKKKKVSVAESGHPAKAKTAPKPAPVLEKIPPAPPPQPVAAPTAPPPPPAKKAEPSRPKLKVMSNVTVRELAEKLNIGVGEFIKKLMSLGAFATINQRLDADTAILAAAEYGVELEIQPLYGEEMLLAEGSAPDDPKDLRPRPPVITVMGHVDHGKTSLLDVLRKSRVAEQEAGGITQHLGASKVATPKGTLVFLDTPGHEAFSAMRARGAKATDIVVLVVAANDGVMTQTIEAIDHAKAANVPILVAINKIDLPDANPERVRQDLGKYGLIPEQWGGKTVMVEVSAKRRQNLEKLLDMLLLSGEMLELKANPNRPASGVILEARMHAKKGAVASLLVQNGTLNVGDNFVTGLAYGRVRALQDEHGTRLEKAGPSTPVELLGLNGLPQAGDPFRVVSSDRQARDIAEKRRLILREEALAHRHHVTLQSIHRGSGARAKELKIILKADVQGSLEALRDSLEKLSTQQIHLRVIHAATGSINPSDSILADASDALILGFHVSIEPRAKEEAERREVEIRSYSIIYELLADIKAALEGLLEPQEVEVKLGILQIRNIFQLSKAGKIAGCWVQDGMVRRNAQFKILRGGQVLGRGRVAGLKRFKEDAREVEKGLECGVQLEGAPEFQAGDLLEIFTVEKQARRLETAS